MNYFLAKIILLLMKLQIIHYFPMKIMKNKSKAIENSLMIFIIYRNIKKINK